MKRKLLGLILLYVLGGAILQKAGFSVFGSDPLDASGLPESFFGVITGEVTGYTQSASGYWLRISSICISYDDVMLEEDIGIQCYFSEQPAYLIGDIISVRGTFSVPPVSTNPGQFNTYIYDRSRGIDLIGYEPETVMYCGLSRRQDISWLHRKWCLYKQALLTGRKNLSEVLTGLLNREDAGVFRAMLLGDRSMLPDELGSLYQANGISHILAISGLHIGLVSGMLYGLLRFAGVSYLFSGIVGIWVTFSYGYMTGASDAAMRAAIMLAVGMVGAMLGRTSDLLTAMGISAAVLILCSTWKLYDAGFLFSYGAVLGIGYVYPCLEKGCRLKRKWSKTLGIALAVQAVTLPVMLFFYGTVTPYAVLLNLLVIPLMTPILALGVIGMLTGCAGWAIAGKILYVAGLFLHLITWICGKVIRLPFANVILGAMETWQVLFYYAGLVFICILFGRKAGRKWLPVILCLVCIITGQLIYRRPQDRMTLLDVGQGEAVLLETKSGLHILVDGGSTSEKDVGQYVLASALKYYGVGRLDYVIVTHKDQDHINGILYLLEQADALGTRIDTLLFPKCCEKLEGYTELTALALEHGVRVDYLKPDVKLVSDSFTMTCLSPKADTALEDVNDLSTVLLVSYGSTGLLLTGDISTQVEEQLYPYADVLADLDILKVAHHGSRYSTSEEFLKLTSPRLALISCGADNSYGHPHAELLERLAHAGCEIMDTPHFGAIELRFYEEGWKVEGWHMLQRGEGD